MSKAKLLYPPFIWSSQKLGLMEDRNRTRWTADVRRQMRHGRWDWSA